DSAGAPLVAAVPAGADPTDVEARVRAAGGRISFARMLRPDRARPRGVSAEDFARFNELLATSVQRGVPLLHGVRDLAREMRSEKFRRSLERVGESLERGASLREAFAPESSDFPRLYGSLIEAGAAAGNLSEVRLALSRNIRMDAVFRRGLIEAFVYPILLFILCCAFLSGFATFMLPRYEHVAHAVSMTMPKLTEIMTAQTASGKLVVALVGGTILVLAALWFFWVRMIRLGREVGEATGRRLPFFKRLYEAAVWSNAADTLALLIRARVPAPAALRLAGPATGTRWLTQAFGQLANEVETGKALATAAREDPEIPYRFVCAVDAGEAKGDLADAMARLAREYRFRSEQQANLFVRYLPPTLAVGFGVLVFLTALSVLGPYIKFWGAAW
ncbi:MAG: type II secretion system F family protein, partial [Pseudomonadota bacterium]